MGHEEQDNANFLRSLHHICFHAAADGGGAGVIRSASECGHYGWVPAAGSAGLRTTDLPRRELHLDPRLLELGLKLRRLLLGSWDLGAGAGGRFFVDSGLLGLGRQRICFL